MFAVFSRLSRNYNRWQRRSWIDNILEHPKFLWGLIGVNVGVYGLWQYGIGMYQTKGDPGFLKWMHNNFTVINGYCRDHGLPSLATFHTRNSCIWASVYVSFLLV